jgi:hypothetical protein
MAKDIKTDLNIDGDLEITGTITTINIPGPYGDDSEAATGGVAVGGIYYKREETGQGGLIAIRLT